MRSSLAPPPRLGQASLRDHRECRIDVVYVIGVPWLRTAVWTLSMAVIALIFVRLF
jgi:hypothetical protein